MLQCFFSSPTIIHSWPGFARADLPLHQLMNFHPTVSAIVPARNEEATIAAAVESLAAQPEIKEIIVINDQSTDGTAAALQELSSRYAQLRVLDTKELPPGWVGKNYAVSLGAAQATG